MSLKMLRTAFVGLVLSISSVANAGLINVSYIEITNANGDWLQVAEVIANDMLDNDVAIDGLAVASAPNQWSQKSGAENAIDGITLGNYHLGQIFHELTQNSTLTITFNTLQDISSFKIFGRTDCCANRDIYNVNFFSDTNRLIATYENIAPNTKTAVPEPSTLAIFALGVIGLASRRVKNK